MTKPRNRFKGMDGKMQAPDGTNYISFRGLTDEFAKLDCFRVRMNQGAAQCHSTPQRHLAPVFNRVSVRLRPVCQLLVPWRAGMRTRRAPLEQAILDCLQAIDELAAQWSPTVGTAERQTLERVLVDLRRRRKAK
jgi:hypothetical protein